MALSRVLSALILSSGLAWAAPPPDSLAAADGMFRKGEFKQAAALYREVIASNPASDTGHAGLVRSLIKLNDIDAAREASDRACRAVPAGAAVLAASGDLLTRRGAFADAEETYSRALKSDPRNARALLGLAYLHFSDFNRKTARLMASRAYESDPTDPEIIIAHEGPHLPLALRIELLEKYLELATNQFPERRTDAASKLAFLRKAGDVKTWQLQGDTRSVILPLKHFVERPGTYSDGFLLRAVVNGGKPVELLLDSGADGLLLSRKLATKLGIEMVAEAAVRGLGDRGDQSAGIGLAKSIAFGPVEFRNCTVTCMDKFRSARIDGILGTSVFAPFLVALDFPARTLELAPLPPVGGKGLDDPESWSGLDRPFVGDLSHFSKVRYWGHILVETVLNERHRSWFFLDTGASLNFMSAELAGQMTRLQSLGKSAQGLSGPIETYSAGSVTMLVGNISQRNDGMLAISLKDLSHKTGTEIGGLIGFPMLRQLRVVLDYRDGLVNFEYPLNQK